MGSFSVISSIISPFPWPPVPTIVAILITSHLQHILQSWHRPVQSGPGLGIHFAFIKIPFIRAFSSLILSKSGLLNVSTQTRGGDWWAHTPPPQLGYEYQSGTVPHPWPGDTLAKLSCWLEPGRAGGRENLLGAGYESQMLIGTHIRPCHLVHTLGSLQTSTHHVTHLRRPSVWPLARLLAETWCLLLLSIF